MRLIKKMLCAGAVVTMAMSVSAEDNMASLRHQYMQAQMEKTRLDNKIGSLYHQLNPHSSKEFMALYKKKEQAIKKISSTERKFMEKTAAGKALYSKIDELNKAINNDLESGDYEKRKIKIAERNRLKSQVDAKLMQCMMNRTIDPSVMKAKTDYLKCVETINQFKFNKIKNQPAAKGIVKKYEAINAKIEDIKKKGKALMAARQKK